MWNTKFFCFKSIGIHGIYYWNEYFLLMIMKNLRRGINYYF